MSGIKERVESVWFVSEGVENSVQRGMQVMNVFGNDVCQGSVLGLLPTCSDRVEVGGIRRQPFHLNPGSADSPTIVGQPSDVHASDPTR